MPCQNCTEIYTKGKALKGRRECVFRGEVKKTLITVCEVLKKPFNFNSVERGHPQYNEKTGALH